MLVPACPGEELDAYDAARDVHLPGVRRFRPRPVADGDGGRARACSAGLGFADAALMDAHGDRAHPVMEQGFRRHNELNVGAVGGHRIDLRGSVEPGRFELRQFRQGNHGVRVAHADGQGRARHIQAVRGHEGIHGFGGCFPGENEFPRTHVHRVGLTRPDHGLDAAAGSDGERAAVGQVNQALSPQVVHKNADAVATHFREGAVAIAVVHEPLGLRAGPQQRAAFGEES